MALATQEKVEHPNLSNHPTTPSEIRFQKLLNANIHWIKRQYGRNKQAKNIIDNLESLYRFSSNLRSVDLCGSNEVRVTLQGYDSRSAGKAEATMCFLGGYYTAIRALTLKQVDEAILRWKKDLSMIPEAKIIPVDFRKNEIELDRILKAERKQEPTTIYRGAEEISKAAGIEYNEIKTYVEERGLPAFKIPGRKFWYAFPIEIATWKINRETMSADAN